jgi:hypothetical protein
MVDGILFRRNARYGLPIAKMVGFSERAAILYDVKEWGIGFGQGS